MVTALIMQASFSLGDLSRSSSNLLNSVAMLFYLHNTIIYLGQPFQKQSDCISYRCNKHHIMHIKQVQINAHVHIHVDHVESSSKLATKWHK